MIGGVVVRRDLGHGAGDPVRARRRGRASPGPATTRTSSRSGSSCSPSPGTLRLIGAQMVGGEGIKERADFLAMAVRVGITLRRTGDDGERLLAADRRAERADRPGRAERRWPRSEERPRCPPADWLRAEREHYLLRGRAAARDRGPYGASPATAAARPDELFWPQVFVPVYRVLPWSLRRRGDAPDARAATARRWTDPNQPARPGGLTRRPGEATHTHTAKEPQMPKTVTDPAPRRGRASSTTPRRRSSRTSRPTPARRRSSSSTPCRSRARSPWSTC